MPRRMTPDEIREFLTRGTRTAKLATVSANGAPHAMPVWFVLDGEQLVFTTGAGTVKGRNLQRDSRVALVVDDEEPPFTDIGGRYMGSHRAEEFGRRNAVPGELLVRVSPERVIAETDVAGYAPGAPR
jgi:Pyridoxamine 5'-phosphate oxidase